MKNSKKWLLSLGSVAAIAAPVAAVVACGSNSDSSKDNGSNDGTNDGSNSTIDIKDESVLKLPAINIVKNISLDTEGTDDFAKAAKAVINKLNESGFEGISKIVVTLKNGNDDLETAIIDMSSLKLYGNQKDSNGTEIPNSAGNKDGTEMIDSKVDEYLNQKSLKIDATTHKLVINDNNNLNVNTNEDVKKVEYALRMMIAGVTKLEQFPGNATSTNGFLISHGSGSWNYPITASAKQIENARKPWVKSATSTGSGSGS